MLTAFSPHASHRSLLIRAGCGLSLAVALLIGVTGCPGGSKDAANQVSGKVTLGTEPVMGTIVFVGPDGKENQTPIMANGNYKLDNPPIGKCKILVRGMGGTGAAVVKDTPAVKDAPNLGGGGGAGPPPKYGDVKTSDLEYEVKAGKQTHDVVLKK